MFGLGRRRCRVGATGAARCSPSRRLERPHASDPGRLAPGIPTPRGRPRSLGSCGLGDRFLADLVLRAELEAAQGPGKRGRARPRARVPLRVHQFQRDGTVSYSRAEILLTNQESCGSVGARRARWRTRNNAAAALSNAPTNSRQIQYPKLEGHLALPCDLAMGRSARLHRDVSRAKKGRLGWILSLTVAPLQ